MSKEPATYETLDAEGRAITADLVELLHKDYAHIKTGGVYIVREFIWDADIDEWAVLYQRKDLAGVKFKRNLMNFLFNKDGTKRFVQLDYGKTKPTSRDSGCCGENR